MSENLPDHRKSNPEGHKTSHGESEIESDSSTGTGAGRNKSRNRVVRRNSLAGKIRKSNANDLVVVAFVMALIAQLVPFGIILNGVSLFFLVKVFRSRVKPKPVLLFISVTIALWNLFCFGRLIAMSVMFAHFYSKFSA